MKEFAEASAGKRQRSPPGTAKLNVVTGYSSIAVVARKMAIPTVLNNVLDLRETLLIVVFLLG